MAKPAKKGKMSGRSPHVEPAMGAKGMMGKKGKKGMKGGKSGRSEQGESVMGKTFKNKGDMKGRSQSHNGRTDDPDMDLSISMMKQIKAKKGKGSKKQQNGRSE